MIATQVALRHCGKRVAKVRPLLATLPVIVVYGWQALRMHIPWASGLMQWAEARG